MQPAALALRPARGRAAPLAQRAARRHFQELEVSVTLDRDVAVRRARADAARALDRALGRQRPALREGPRGWPRERLGARAQPATAAPCGSPSTARARARRRRFSLTDAGLPAGEYELPYRWSEAGRAGATGTARVIFYAPVREAAEEEGADWTELLRDVNVTNDGSTESETFLTAVPGNRLRFAVGANGGGGYNAWITNTGAAPFTKVTMSTTIDAPAEAGPETAALCCDPMSAADALGQHLVRRPGAGQRRRQPEPDRRRALGAGHDDVRQHRGPAGSHGRHAGQADDDDRQLAVEPGVRPPVRGLERARAAASGSSSRNATRGPVGSRTRRTATTPTTGARRSR